MLGEELQGTQQFWLRELLVLSLSAEDYAHPVAYRADRLLVAVPGNGSHGIPLSRRRTICKSVKEDGQQGRIADLL
jgi:hypothetical protein